MPADIAELVERNKNHASNHTPIPTIEEMMRSQGPPGVMIGISHSARPYASFFSCMDPRVVPEDIFELKKDAFTIRNIAGHPQSVMNEILTIDAFIPLKEILVLHHTDCGATHFTDDAVRAKLMERLPENKEFGTMSFGAIADLDQSVREDVNFLRTSPLITEELAKQTRGFLYDIETGELREIKV
ncbi:hypothetical protein MMC20_005238 [Loxospora ochrophaea]|nr:hypothetical protein [Loxospora ochrophaea]